jgi:hypothetical protein
MLIFKDFYAWFLRTSVSQLLKPVWPAQMRWSSVVVLSLRWDASYDITAGINYGRLGRELAPEGLEYAQMRSTS